MSFVRLLALGKSLMSIKDTPNHYRLVRWNWPPKFRSSTDTFTSGGDEPLGNTASGRTLQKSAENLCCAATEQNSPQHIPGGVKFAHKWFRGLSPFAFKTGARSGAARGAKPAKPVQYELSLDTVSVVRNDLSDADIEVVPLRTVPESASLKAEAPLANGAFAGPMVFTKPSLPSYLAQPMKRS